MHAAAASGDHDLCRRLQSNGSGRECPRAKMGRAPLHDAMGAMSTSITVTVDVDLIQNWERTSMLRQVSERCRLRSRLSLVSAATERLQLII